MIVKLWDKLQVFRAVSPEHSLFAHISIEVDKGFDHKSDI